MEYCQYHPVSAATFKCHVCNSHYCELCVNEASQSERDCFDCKAKCESLGARFSATPFWRRLQESFRYPLHSNALIVLVVASLLSTFSAFYVMNFLILGCFLKYCFSCLYDTAHGSMTAPSISSAFEGGFILAAQLFVIVVAVVFAIAFSIFWVGGTFGAIVSIFFLVGMPAVMINFALSNSFFYAINPLNSFKLVAAIGLPYGLLLVLIAIMMGSARVASQLFMMDGYYFFLYSAIDQLIGNYYLMVVFHIMGYMLFQYQGQLGFEASSSEHRSAERLDVDIKMAYIETRIKQGEFDLAATQFAQLVKNYRDDSTVYGRCFSFLIALKNKFYLEQFAPVYLRFLQDKNHHDQLLPSYKKIINALPDYKPKTASNRLVIAKVAHYRGDNRTAAKLLSGLHKDHPDFESLDVAYQLMSTVLHDLGNMDAQAKQYAAMAKKLSDKKASELSSKPKPKKVALSLSPTDEPIRAKAPAPESSTSTGNDPYSPIEFISPSKPSS